MTTTICVVNRLEYDVNAIKRQKLCYCPLDCEVVSDSNRLQSSQLTKVGVPRLNMTRVEKVLLETQTTTIGGGVVLQLKKLLKHSLGVEIYAMILTNSVTANLKGTLSCYGSISRA